MNYQNIFELFGYSEFSPEVKRLFNKLDIPLERPENSVCWRTFQSKTLDLTLVFKGKNNYHHDYGPIKQSSLETHDESVLEEINFGSYAGKIHYPFSLPYNFSFSDKPENIKEKVGMKPSESSDASYGSYFLFNTADYQILTGFDKTDKLIWVRIRPLELTFKKKRELTKSLKQQDKNINDLNLSQLTDLKKQSPTVTWYDRLSDGDNIFNKGNIKDTANVLNYFIDNLITATKKKKANAIYSATKKAVLNINKLNDKHQSFIDTMEREELVDYIHKAIQLTGFKVNNGIDLTEEWREW